MYLAYKYLQKARAAMWVLGTEPRSSVRAASPLNCSVPPASGVEQSLSTHTPTVGDRGQLELKGSCPINLCMESLHSKEPLGPTCWDMDFALSKGKGSKMASSRVRARRKDN